MQRIFYSLLFILVYTLTQAQVANRAPYIQSPDQHSAIIAFNTATAGLGIVRYGATPSALNDSVTDISANQLHSLQITGLQPNTKYYYQALCGSLTGNVDYFYTAKPDNIRQMDFVVYGDCGFNSKQQDSIAAHLALTPQDFGLVVGDVDQLTGNNYDVNYFPHYTKMTKNVCHFTAIGNHDTLTNQTNYTDAFYLPHNNPANTELYYSFTWGHAKFIALDGNIDCTVGSAQYTWLEQQLKCNNSEFTFIYFHQPPWTNGWDISYLIPFQYWYQYSGNVDMRTNLVPLFEKYHVDAVLNGHAHNYQRGIYHGVHYFIAGGGGTSTPDTHQNSNSPNIQYEQDVNNFMQFSINGDSVHYYALGLDGSAIDSGSFTKSFAPYVANVTTQSVGCGAANNGSALAEVSGPRGPYSFAWSNGQNAPLDTALTAGTYTLTITDNSGCITYDSASVIASDSVIPVQISATEISGTTVQLSANPANVGSYTWILPNGLTLTDTAATIYYTYADTGIYTVRLVANENCGMFNAAVNVYAPAAVINIAGNSFNIEVYPNPFRNQTILKVTSLVGRSFDATLYNIEGQQVRSFTGNTANPMIIKADGLAPGYYLIAVTIEGARTTLRLLVQ